VEKWVPWDDAVNDKAGNILLSRMMGADVRLDPSGFDIGIRRSWEVALREVEEAGGSPTRSRPAARSASPRPRSTSPRVRLPPAKSARDDIEEIDHGNKRRAGSLSCH
jgi:hypothetical protein